MKIKEVIQIDEIAPLIGLAARGLAAVGGRAAVGRTAVGAVGGRAAVGRTAATGATQKVKTTVGTQGTQGTLQQRLKAQGKEKAVKTAKDVIGKMFSKPNSKEPGGDIKKGQEVEFDDPKKPGSTVTYKVKAIGGRDVTVEPKKKRDGSPDHVVFDKKTLANKL